MENDIYKERTGKGCSGTVVPSKKRIYPRYYGSLWDTSTFKVFGTYRNGSFLFEKYMDEK